MLGSMLQKKYIKLTGTIWHAAMWVHCNKLTYYGVISVRNQKRTTASTSTAETCNGKRSLRGLATNGLALVLLAASGGALAQTVSQTGLPLAVEDGGLSWKGITLYGIIDAAVQYETHGAPFNDYFISGGSDIVQKNSNNSVFGVTSNGLSQSRVGLQGSEPLHFMDFSGVFKLETFFNPASGNLTDALKSVTQNNGRSLADQSTNIDSSIAGQIFQQSFVGVSSPTYGTVTFGRQNTTLADLVAKYDPQQVSYAFSVVGLSGTPAGGGDTQDRRLDDSVKYSAKLFNLVHLGLQYKFQNSSAENYCDRRQRRGLHRDRGFAGRGVCGRVGRRLLHEGEGRRLDRCVERHPGDGIAGGLFARQVAFRHDLGQCRLWRHGVLCVRSGDLLRRL